MSDYLKKRLPVLLLGLSIIIFSIFIFFSETYVAHGKHTSTTYTGHNAVLWSYSFFCFGLSLFSILLKNKLLIYLIMVTLISLAAFIPLFFIK